MKLALPDDEVDPAEDLVTLDDDVQVFDRQHFVAGGAGPGELGGLGAFRSTRGLGDHACIRHANHVRRAVGLPLRP